MNKLSLIVSLSLLLMVSTGCRGSQNNEQAVTEPTDKNAGQQAQNFPDPTTEGTAPPPPALIRSTNPDQRYGNIPKGSSMPNRNPFASIIKPTGSVNAQDETIKVSPLPTGTSSVSYNGAATETRDMTSKGKNTGKIDANIQTKKPDVSSVALNKTPTSKQSLPSSIPIPPPPKLTPDIPSGIIPTNASGQLRTTGSVPKVRPDFTLAPIPKPEPDQARAVSVTGILDINGEKHAIVKAPGEAHSRYVKTGDLLANGQVLVKRIDANKNNPYVILEQLGQEVVLVAGAPSTEKN